MKTSFLLVLILNIMLLTALSVSAADTEAPASAADAAFAELDDTVDAKEGDAEEGDAEEAEDVKFTKPKLKQIAATIKARQSGLQDSDYAAVMKQLNVENVKKLNNLYNRFRAQDAKVLKAGESTTAKAAIKKYKSPARLKKQGALHRKIGKRFVVYYPKYMIVYEKRKPVKKLTEDALDIDSLLTAADTTFVRTTQEVMMESFINWAGKVRAKVYIVVNPDDWQSLRPASRKSPVQTVITKDGNREFFVYAGPKVYDYSSAALNYAVSELTLKEYSMAMGGERETKLPEFFIAGLATKLSELDSVITTDGPVQLKKYGTKNVSGAMLRKLRAGSSEYTQMPLHTRKLISFEALVRPKSYPKDNEAMYYYIRQSSALVDYLSQNGPLSFLTMSEALSDGQRFEKSFNDTYVEFRNQFSGKENSSKKKSNSRSKESREDRKKARRDEKDRKEKQEVAEDILNGYKELRRGAEDEIFVPLTFEYLKGITPDKKSSKKTKQPGKPTRSMIDSPIGR